ncbi:MAG: restriction endonuclease [Cytophagales bacterium]|nr:restriction endonuclease [Cytophagales bacterium]
MESHSTCPLLSPIQFEKHVYKLLSNLGKDLTNFKAEHRAKLIGLDGEYEIDVVACFEVFGTNFKVLVECKCHHYSIKRDVVQVLNDRIRTIGAQKGIIFSTSNYQKGAIDYASKHGIALIRVSKDELTWKTRNKADDSNDINLPIISWIVFSDPEVLNTTTLDRDTHQLQNILFN